MSVIVCVIRLRIFHIFVSPPYPNLSYPPTLSHPIFHPKLLLILPDLMTSSPHTFLFFTSFFQYKLCKVLFFFHFSVYCFFKFTKENFLSMVVSLINTSGPYPNFFVCLFFIVFVSFFFHYFLVRPFPLFYSFFFCSCPLCGAETEVYRDLRITE